MKIENLTNYISPNMEIVNIEVEQCVLNGSNGFSIENIGNSKDDQDW